MELYFLFLVCFATLLLTPSSSSPPSPNGKYDDCSKNLTCGTITNISYPFYDGSTRPDYCGHPGFELDCDDDTQQITISGNTYGLVNFGNHSITVSRADNLTDLICPIRLANTTIDFSKLEFTSSDENITFFYSCNTEGSAALAQVPTPLRGSCILEASSSTTNGYYLTPSMEESHQEDLFRMCDNLVIPALKQNVELIDASHTAADLFFAVHEGFELDMTADYDSCDACLTSGGECGHNPDSDYKDFICHCSDADHPNKCKGRKRTARNTIAISVGIGIVVLGLLILFPIYVLRKCKPAPKNQRVEDLLKNYASLVPRRYTYANILKMTNSFREKLGEGGYGTVYRGKLQDGRVVAVKVLKKSKGDGNEFLNEVASISSTSHVNIVPLLGFCFEGPKGALVYEFMPNGSLEKFIRGRDVNTDNETLSFQRLFEIAVGIARGLEYLHRDCNIRIVHFDIKPHNILLDADFTPKISDFGLAKPLKQNESIISISGARGTAGYIAPEVFFSSYGGASHKSDVYSYGMMVLEMVGCTKRTGETVENSSEQYFPRWIYRQLEQETTIVDDGRSLNDEDREVERRLILVGLWCIQTNPRSRPSMHGVVGMLEGEVELEVPPMPYLASPPRQQPPIDDGLSARFLSSTSYVASSL